MPINRLYDLYQALGGVVIEVVLKNRPKKYRINKIICRVALIAKQICKSKLLLIIKKTGKQAKI